MNALQTIQVELGERSYPIWIGPQLLKQLPDYLKKLNISSTQKLLMITDEHVAQHYLEPLTELLALNYSVYSYVIPAGEESKSLTQYEQIMTYALQQKLDRQAVILALGGGVVGDLAGFVASTFMRGVAFIQLPTTVLAHDSSVGGKVAVNHPLGKNLIGSFYQPLAVIYDTETLQTLPEREIRSGLAEVLKLGFIRDAEFLTWLREHQQELSALQEPFLSEALGRACQIKAEIVSQDEKEEGIRALLNLGHTFGHALEALGEYQDYTHGEGVSIGMALAARVSESVYKVQGIEQEVLSLLHLYRLPTRYEREWSPEQILEKMYSDKKVLAGALNLVLLRRIGEGELVANVSPDIILQALEDNRKMGS